MPGHVNGRSPWEKKDGESDLWYGRFHSYLMAGTERSVQDAYRRHCESQAQSGGNQARPPSPRHLPGAWTAAATKWDWLGRARAWDDDERRRVRKAHYEAVKKANERHQIVLRSTFGKALTQSQNLDWASIKSPAVFVPLLAQIIRLEREVLGTPVGIEITHKNGQPGESTDFERATQEASADVSPDRFKASPEMYAAVLEVLAAHEVKPEPESATPLDHAAEEA
jgi:hypothetical protein